MHIQSRTIHIIGFGSQGRAWAQMLRKAGWDVRLYLRENASPETLAAAEVLNFKHLPFSALATARDPLVALLLPDHLIGAFYREYLARNESAVTLVLAHGYAVYSNDLERLAPTHEAALLAPKAIGPQLLKAFNEAHPKPHARAAAFHARAARHEEVRALAHGLGFSDENLIGATFEQEAIGDLISEQGLLCGGLFTLLEQVLKNMHEAGVPTRLIREECLTELELIAGLLTARGPASTFAAISPAAQCGAVTTRERLLNSGISEALRAQAATVLDKSFVQTMRDPGWKQKASELRQTLQMWEERLK